MGTLHREIVFLATHIPNNCVISRTISGGSISFCAMPDADFTTAHPALGKTLRNTCRRCTRTLCSRAIVPRLGTSLHYSVAPVPLRGSTRNSIVIVACQRLRPLSGGQRRDFTPEPSAACCCCFPLLPLPPLATCLETSVNCSLLCSAIGQV
jgi:hypothetical protein